jgi:hypothetical protein
LVLVVASFLWVLSAFGDSITETVFPGSHSFLDDYVYLPGIKAREELYAGEAVAAYARRASGGTRLIAFSYGGTRELAETETKKLFESQGIPYPEPLSVEGGQ